MHQKPALSPQDDVVMALAYHTWADGLDRQFSWSPDRATQHLVTDETIRSVVVGNPLRSHMARLRRGVRFDDRFPEVPGRFLVQPRRWRRADSPSVDATLRTYRRLDAWLFDVSRRRGQHRPVLVSCHPVLAAVASRGRWRDVVYYGWDDWLTYPPHEEIRDLMLYSYRLMAEHEVNVIGVTQAILDRIGSPRGTVVPNGIDASDHHRATEPPAWFSALPRPVALYAGALQERVDVDALARLAQDLPDWTIVLVGPLLEPALFEKLELERNVLIKPMEPRPAVLEMMARADVCLVPHRRTPMSEAMSPLKLYEYLAAGANVVATDLEPMRGVSEHCLLVEEGAPLAPAVLTVTARPRATAEEVEAFRRVHDWSARYLTWRQAALGR